LGKKQYQAEHTKSQKKATRKMPHYLRNNTVVFSS
jgi:hypothetical protein